MSIPFVQYLMPSGRQTEITIDRSEEIEAKARAILAGGCVFEAEMLSDYRSISLTVADPTRGVDVEIEVVPNGPEVPEAVDRLVESAYRRLAPATRDGATS